MDVNTLHRGCSIKLVASSAPPIPVSSRTMSHFLRKNQRKASAVSISNTVGWEKPFCVIFRHASAVSSIQEAYSDSPIHAPLIWQTSRRSKTAGELNCPTIYPASFNAEARKQLTEPFPFVPAMCTTFNSACTSFSSCIRRRIVSRPKMLPYFFASSWNCTDCVKFIYDPAFLLSYLVQNLRCQA